MTDKMRTLPETVTEVYALLEPLESDRRQRVIASVLALLGEEAAPVPVGVGAASAGGDAESEASFGSKANRWIAQNGLTSEMLAEVFHREGNAVELIANTVPGSGKRGQSQNCYLLAGARALLASDEAKFTDAEAVSMCAQFGCYDRPNHAITRRSLGNSFSGNKNQGFSLTGPGLKAAAELIKQMKS